MSQRAAFGAEPRTARDRFVIRELTVNPACHYCREVFSHWTDATVDHVVPRWRGGLSHPENLVLACGPCNAGRKGHRDHDELCGCRMGAIARAAIARVRAELRGGPLTHVHGRERAARERAHRESGGTPTTLAALGFEHDERFAERESAVAAAAVSHPRGSSRYSQRRDGYVEAERLRGERAGGGPARRGIATASVEDIARARQARRSRAPSGGESGGGA